MNEEDLKGMTVNERLYALDLMDSFDKAMKNRDSKKGIQVLLQAKLSEQQANETVTSILETPEKYGY